MKTAIALLLIFFSVWGQKTREKEKEIYNGKKFSLRVITRYSGGEESYKVNLLAVNHAPYIDEPYSLLQRNKTGFVYTYKGRYLRRNFKSIYDGEPNSFYWFIIRLQELLDENDPGKGYDIAKRHIAVANDSKSGIIVSYLDDTSYYFCPKEEIRSVIESFENWADKNSLSYK